MVEVARALVAKGLNLGSEGNVSCRQGERILLTPTAVDPAHLQAADVAVLDSDGTSLEGRSPTSEWRFHLRIYAARPDVHAVVHTHSPWASAVACTRRDLPPFHYMVAALGTDRVRCTAYAPPASAQLSEFVVQALGESRACLIANHGAVAVGVDLDEAVAMARLLESLAHQYALTCMLGGAEPLTSDQTRELREIFAGYGKAGPEDES